MGKGISYPVRGLRTPDWSQKIEVAHSQSLHNDHAAVLSFLSWHSSSRKKTESCQLPTPEVTALHSGLCSHHCK